MSVSYPTGPPNSYWPQYPYPSPPVIEQGWQCPVCKSVFARWVAQCSNCKPKVQPTADKAT